MFRCFILLDTILLGQDSPDKSCQKFVGGEIRHILLLKHCSINGPLKTVIKCNKNSESGENDNYTQYNAYSETLC
ncbi:hypothetical protein WN55_09325 [Dufourea novaeangliae]|uniref:Secreted protein n=1 Tax=Dufourea novaeangliae TaxID=178035 RepID=A0A154P9A8_DUFNO|nr:hypothetical protein WN55_09325 [Dufourea novaeangliae]